MMRATLGFCVLVAGSVGWGAAANLLPNPGFEQADAAGLPVGWRVQDWPPEDPPESAAKVVTRGMHRGRGALRIHTAAEPSDFGVLSLPVGLGEAAAEPLRVSLFYRTEGDPRAYVAFHTFGEPFAAREWQTPPVQIEQRPLPPSKDWRQLAWTFEVDPPAREFVCTVRLTGTGDVLVDDVVLHPAQSGAWLEVTEAGVAVDCRQRRRLEVRVHNQGPADSFEVAATPLRQDGKPGKEMLASCQVGQGEEDTVAFQSDLDLARRHAVGLALYDPDSQEPLDGLVAPIEPLITGRIVQPNFHATLLPDLPVDTVVAEGRLNATRELAAQLRLSAQMIGVGLEAREGAGLTRAEDGLAWRAEFPTRALLRGGYVVRVEATDSGRTVSTLGLGLERAGQEGPSVSYDPEGRLLVAGKPFFTHGIYNVRELTDLALVAQHGYNTVVTPANWAHDAYLKEAQNLGLHVILYCPHPPVRGAFNSPQAGDWWVNAARRWGSEPTVLGWHLVARPDLLMVPPDVFAEDRALLQKVDPLHPSLALVNTPSLFAAYAAGADILIAALQPVPSTPLARAAFYMGAAVQAVGPERPAWAAIQATGRAWTAGSPYEEDTTGRPPTAAEHRALTVLALVHGARGLLDFAFTYGDVGGPEGTPRVAYRVAARAPELWAGMKETNALVARLSPAVLAGRRLGASAGGAVHVGAWELPDRLVVAAVNTTEAPAVAQFEVPGAQATTLRLLGGADDLEAAGGRFMDAFGPYEVRLYETPRTVARVPGAVDTSEAR